jgi:predicted secreted hydrolase
MKYVSVAVITVVIVIVVLTFWSPPESAVRTPRNAGSSPRLAELLGNQEIDGYASAVEPRDFVFPADHGPHPEFRNEWWYVTGNLDGESGDRFGFELTIFRFSLTPLQNNAASRSAWKTNQVYIGHFALTDVGNATFHVAQRHARGALGLAGSQREPYRVWIEDWFIELDDNSWWLNASDGDIAIDLFLDPLKPPVLNGVDGLSQKSSAPGNASYYYSLSRLETAGTLKISTSALSREQRGWDWFSIQLSDGSELMFYSLRKIDGSRDVHSAGTWIAADAESRYLENDDVVIDVEDYWQSPHGGTYPMGWRLQVPKLGLDIRVRPVLDAQELRTIVRYWEGAVDVVGEKSGSPIDGRGYVELTGYGDVDLDSMH